MNKLPKLIIPLLALIVAIELAAVYFRKHSPALLNTHGQIANQERNLIIFAAALSLIVVIPVFVMTIVIATRYREDNKKKVKYSPNWDHDRRIETVWWLVPTILITILSVVTWNSSHTLDPYRAIKSDVKPIRVQVVALQWKWLFIYPDQNLASVNSLTIPTNTPINFEVTADAPMNSFWIPELSGQIYAMSGMSTQLHVMANQEGIYTGRSANISGDGFAGMQFNVQAVPPATFNQWLAGIKSGDNILNRRAYMQLAEPSHNDPESYYASTQPMLYDMIVARTAPDGKPELIDL